MFTKIAIATSFAALITSNAAATEMPDLARKHQCVNCHMIEKQFVGPAWQDVANKYKGDAEAPARLIAKIAAGGKGVWGPIPMPDNPQVSEADRTELVAFILGLAR
ncbi:MAG: c-type cytochrome [Gallionella sp.]